MFKWKTRAFNVDEIDGWGWFHQHFTCTFFVQKCFFSPKSFHQSQNITRELAKRLSYKKSNFRDRTFSRSSHQRKSNEWKKQCRGSPDPFFAIFGIHCIWCTCRLRGRCENRLTWENVDIGILNYEPAGISHKGRSVVIMLAFFCSKLGLRQ